MTRCTPCNHPWIHAIVVFTALAALCLKPALPALASDTTEIEDLKAQVKTLLERIEQLEQKQKAQTAPKVRAYWKNGFRIESKDEETGREYTFRFRTGVQLRYSYFLADEDLAAHTENFSSFTMRRLRFYVDGSAPSKDWKYYVHVQLEPQSAVHTHDAYMVWQKYRYARVQFGRMKIPFDLEYWQSGFMQNGVDRTIFTGDSEVDKDAFGARTYDFPGDNARLRVGSHLDRNGFPTGGMLLYRSQGVNVNGYVDMFGQKDFFTYWAGVFNGRDTQALANTDDEMLYSFMAGINFLPGSDPAGPMGPGGFNNYYMQGDYGYNTRPLAALVVAGFTNRNRVDRYYSPDNASGNFGASKTGAHDTRNYGFDAALLFRYMGWSCDVEAGWEEFVQDPDGSALDMEATWDRWAARINVGYFVVPKKWEFVFKAAYFERVEANTLENSLASGLGLVLLQDGYAVEDNLQQYRVGVNYYFHGFNQYVSADLGWLRREFKEIDGSEAAALNFTGARSSDLEDQDDLSVRLQYQHFF